METTLGLTSKQLLAKLKEFEGFRAVAYRDAAGVWTIGYGHTRKVRRGDKISEYYATEYLCLDIMEAERQVLKLGVCKTQGQLDALTSFVFNLGIARLRKSTLLKCIASGLPEAAIRKEWMRWVYAGGRVLKGLEKRRQWETDRFFTPNTPTLELLAAVNAQ